MSVVSRKSYWPYDEVTVSRDYASGRFCFSTPWLSASIEVEGSDVSRANAISEKLSSQQVSAHDLPEVSWLLSSLSHYPLSYVLPRPHSEPSCDQHVVVDGNLIGHLPSSLLSLLIGQSERAAGVDGQIITNSTPLICQDNWKWDLSSALEFSRMPGGHDPISLFSVARRFHLLDSVENNKTESLVEFIRGLRGEADRFRNAAALVVRQNHYVTQKCDSCLRPALEIALGTRHHVRAFMRAEAGHDVILGRAMKALGSQPSEVPVLSVVIALMEVFHFVSQRNFLAFAMVVDMFERSSYLEKDPLAGLLNEGGLSGAAKQIDTHREINDLGGHENVAVSFLETMAPVGADYAEEAFMLAELVTVLLHRISADLVETLKMAQPTEKAS